MKRQTLSRDLDKTRDRLLDINERLLAHKTKAAKEAQRFVHEASCLLDLASDWIHQLETGGGAAVLSATSQTMRRAKQLRGAK